MRRARSRPGKHETGADPVLIANASSVARMGALAEPGVTVVAAAIRQCHFRRTRSSVVPLAHLADHLARSARVSKKRTLKRLPSEGVGEGGPGSRNRLVGKLRPVRDRAAHRGLV